MAKPIFLIGLPNGISSNEIEIIKTMLADKMDDYHVLAYQGNKSEFEFRVFYEKDFNEVKFEQLKEIVKRKTENK